MNINDVEMKIVESEEGLAALVDEASGIKMDLRKKKEALASAILKHKNKERRPASLKVQREAVSSASAELESLEGAIEILENEKLDLELKKMVVELHQSQGIKFQEALKACKQQSEKLSELSSTLQSALTDFSSGVNALIEVVAETRGSYREIVKNLPGEFCLRSFEAGKLEKVEDLESEVKDRAKAAGDINSKIQKLSEIAPPASEEDIPAFAEAVQKLSQWQMYIIKSDLSARHAFRFSKVRKMKPIHQQMQPKQFNRYVLANPENFNPMRVRQAKEELGQLEPQGTQERVYANVGKHRE